MEVNIKMLQQAGFLVLGLLVAAWFYIWDKHVKDSDKKQDDIKKGFSKYDGRFEVFRNNMEAVNIKIDENVFKAKESARQFQEKSNDNIRKKMHEDKSEIIGAIKENGEATQKVMELFIDHQLRTEKRMTGVETLVATLVSQK